MPVSGVEKASVPGMERISKYRENSLPHLQGPDKMPLHLGLGSAALVCREASVLMAELRWMGWQKGHPRGSLTSLGTCFASLFVMCCILLWEFVNRIGCVHVLHRARIRSQKGECNEDHSRQLMSEDNGLQKERT